MSGHESEVSPSRWRSAVQRGRSAVSTAISRADDFIVKTTESQGQDYPRVEPDFTYHPNGIADVIDAFSQRQDDLQTTVDELQQKSQAKHDALAQKSNIVRRLNKIAGDSIMRDIAAKEEQIERYKALAASLRDGDLQPSVDFLVKNIAATIGAVNAIVLTGRNPDLKLKQTNDAKLNINLLLQLDRQKGIKLHNELIKAMRGDFALVLDRDPFNLPGF